MGFPKCTHREHGLLLSDCPSCMASKASRASTKDLIPIRSKAHAAGACWSVDFTRAFPVEDIAGSTCTAVFMEVITGYLRVYLLRSHSSRTWHKTWWTGRRRTSALTYAGDCDVLWSSGGDPSSPT